MLGLCQRAERKKSPEPNPLTREPSERACDQTRKSSKVRMTNQDAEDAAWPTRPQRRYLRRIYNGRNIPIHVDGTDFVTYKQAMKYLQTLDEDANNRAVEQMKAAAKAQSDQSAQSASGEVA